MSQDYGPHAPDPLPPPAASARPCAQTRSSGPQGNPGTNVMGLQHNFQEADFFTKKRVFRLQLQACAWCHKRHTPSEPRLVGLGGGSDRAEARGPSSDLCPDQSDPAALGGFRHEGQMKAGALHCRVEDRSQPWASRGNGPELQNGGAHMSSDGPQCHTSDVG